MLTLEDILPVRGSRAVLVGQTGTGKTTLARYLIAHLARQQPVLVIDPKGEWAGPEGTLYVHDVRRIVESNYIVYQPDLKSDVISDVNNLCEAVYDRGDVCVYIDELYGVSVNGREWPDMLQPLYTRGRSRNITVIGAVQRPAWVPLYTLSETQRQYLFLTPMQEDRKRMATIMGPRVENPVKRFFFWYNSVFESIEELPASPIKLNIGK